jgi:hypothetical protein
MDIKNRNDFVTENGEMDSRKNHRVKRKLEELIFLVKKRDGISYSIDDPDFHEWLINCYDEYLMENYGLYQFLNWLIKKYRRE